MGVGVGFDAEELAWADLAGADGGEAVGEGEVFRLFPKVEQLLEGDVEEVAGAAGGVEDGDGGELVEEGGEEVFRVGALPKGGLVGFCVGLAAWWLCFGFSGEGGCCETG